MLQGARRGTKGHHRDVLGAACCKGHSACLSSLCACLDWRWQVRSELKEAASLKDKLEQSNEQIAAKVKEVFNANKAMRDHQTKIQVSAAGCMVKKIAD